MDIYIKIQHTHSAILSYITRHLDLLYTDPHISLLTKSDFKILLKHKYLSVNHEDQTLFSIAKWCEGHRLEMESDLNFTKELWDHVNWNYISLKGITECLFKFKNILYDPNFANCLKAEFTKRSQNIKQEEMIVSDKDPPRIRYKFHRVEDGDSQIYQSTFLQ